MNRQTEGWVGLIRFLRPVNHFIYIRVKHNSSNHKYDLSLFTIPDMSESFLGEILEKMKSNEPVRQTAVVRARGPGSRQSMLRKAIFLLHA